MLLCLLQCLTKLVSNKIINIALIEVAMLKFLQVMYKMLTYGFNTRAANSYQKSPFDSGRALKPQQNPDASLYWQIYIL